MIEIREITRENKEELNLRNEAFPLWGRMIPSLSDGVWEYRLEEFPEIGWMTFPDENYDYELLSRNSLILGAYENGVCVGLAIYQEGFFRYMYLYDLKVNAAARRKGVGRALIEAGYAAAKKKGNLGIYTQAQDNNLDACLFYLGVGFEIGGFDNRVYEGTPQEDKADIFFYLK